MGQKRQGGQVRGRAKAQRPHQDGQPRRDGAQPDRDGLPAVQWPVTQDGVEDEHRPEHHEQHGREDRQVAQRLDGVADDRSRRGRPDDRLRPQQPGPPVRQRQHRHRRRDECQPPEQRTLQCLSPTSVPQCEPDEDVAQPAETAPGYRLQCEPCRRLGNQQGDAVDRRPDGDGQDSRDEPLRTRLRPVLAQSRQQVEGGDRRSERTQREPGDGRHAIATYSRLFTFPGEQLLVTVLGLR